jgi:hypothetical protein
MGNPNWQVFTGETYLRTEPPIDPSSLTHWRKRLGEAGVEELLAETIGAAKRADVIKATSVKRVVVDGTVMHKAVARLMDSRLLERCREHLVKAACARRSSAWQKARTPYEFGVKVSITTTHKEGLLVGMPSMPSNPYDGHTLGEALEQAAILSDVTPEIAVVDRGSKGVDVDGVNIYQPGLRRGITRGLRAMIRRRCDRASYRPYEEGRKARPELAQRYESAIRCTRCRAAPVTTCYRDFPILQAGVDLSIDPFDSHVIGDTFGIQRRDRLHTYKRPC